MKRKFKLISSIASLTAAVALLVVGVFAVATTRGVNVSGSLKFEAFAVDATITVKQGSALSDDTLQPSNLTKVISKTFKTGTGQPGDQEMDDVTLAPVELSDNILVYRYLVEIRNEGSSEIWAKITVADDAASDGTDGLTRTIVEHESGEPFVLDEAIIIGASGVRSLVVTYTVTPKSLTSNTIETFDFGAAVRLATTAEQLTD